MILYLSVCGHGSVALQQLGGRTSADQTDVPVELPGEATFDRRRFSWFWVVSLSMKRLPGGPELS